MRIYNLLASGLKPIDYILIFGLIAVTLAIAAIVIWQKVKGKSGCGGDCGGCPSAKSGGCNGSCDGCNVCPSKKENENDQEKIQ